MKLLRNGFFQTHHYNIGLISAPTATAPMLVTKALSQDVMLLVFSSIANPQGVAQLHSNQLLCIA